METCKNCLHYDICTFHVTGNENEKCTHYTPTADVVPKSEVETLVYKLECLLCHATGSRLSKHTYDLRTMETAVTDYINESYTEGVNDGYKNCAREIFEEIETCMKDFEDDDDGYLLKKCEFEFFMREIKEKYAEQKNG